MTNLDVEMHPELAPLLAGLRHGGIILRLGGRACAVIESATAAPDVDMAAFRASLALPADPGNAVAEMREADDR